LANGLFSTRSLKWNKHSRLFHSESVTTIKSLIKLSTSSTFLPTAFRLRRSSGLRRRLKKASSPAASPITSEAENNGKPAVKISLRDLNSISKPMQPSYEENLALWHSALRANWQQHCHFAEYHYGQISL